MQEKLLSNLYACKNVLINLVNKKFMFETRMKPKLENANKKKKELVSILVLYKISYNKRYECII